MRAQSQIPFVCNRTDSREGDRQIRRRPVDCLPLRILQGLALGPCPGTDRGGESDSRPRLQSQTEDQRSMRIEIVENATIDRLLWDINEGLRLRKLTDLELMSECLNDEISDDPRVRELMFRVKPNWSDEI